VSPPPENGRQLLQGIRIIEFGWAVVGPLTTSWAGHYGAEVIKVETHSRPDIIRTMTPFKDDRHDKDNSLFFGRENAGKISISLNLKHPTAVSLAKRLVGKSDIVLDSYTSGVMNRYGLGYEDLKGIKEDLIMLSSCMYGQTGKLRSMPGYGVPLTAISGLTGLCGWPDRKPAGPYGSYTDYLVPRLNLLALMSALDYRRRTGKGLYIDAAQLEAGVQFVAPSLLNYAANNETGERCGNASPDAAPHGVFPCKGKDEWCAVAVFSDDEWKALINVMGNPTWTKEERFSTLNGRKQNEGELNGHIEAWTKDQDKTALMKKLQEHGIPAGAVNNGKDLAKDPQFGFDKYFKRLPHPVMGEVDYAGHSIHFSKCPQEVKRSPCLGEHTEKVCKEILGLSNDDYDRFLKEGIFE
jgi:crotonobetainyl-CoA:carnitine CoA-transferase CaiB-like acyl-CoA transferase